MKKRARSTAKPRPAAMGAAASTRKMSETLIDFGNPLVRRIKKDSTAQYVDDLFQIIVIIWNAHVRAMRAWGDPAPLRALQDIAADENQPEIMRYAIGALSLRRVQHFRDDVRMVHDWSVSYNPEGGELKFTCQGALPPGSDLGVAAAPPPAAEPDADA